MLEEHGGHVGLSWGEVSWGGGSWGQRKGRGGGGHLQPLEDGLEVVVDVLVEGVVDPVRVLHAAKLLLQMHNLLNVIPRFAVQCRRGAAAGEAPDAAHALRRGVVVDQLLAGGQIPRWRGVVRLPPHQPLVGALGSVGNVASCI